MLECGGRLRRAVSEQPNKRTIPSQTTDRFNVIRRLRIIVGDCSSLSALVGSNMEQTGTRRNALLLLLQPNELIASGLFSVLSQQQKAGYKRRHFSQVFSIPVILLVWVNVSATQHSQVWEVRESIPETSLLSVIIPPNFGHIGS
jgi:hypothetical protein